MATISRYQTASGATLYRVRYRTPERGQTQKRGFTTKRDAEAFAATVEVSKLRGEYVAPSLGRITVGQLGPAWLDRQQGHMKPCGFRSYESAWRIHVAPRWAATRIGDVRFSDVQAWVSDLAARRGPVIVQTAHSVLARILDDAVRDRMLASNPARGVKLPQRPPRRNVYLSATQLQLLADEAGRYHSLVLLLGVGGLRWGEAAALRVVRHRFPAPPYRAAPQRGDVGPARPISAHSRAARTAPWCCRRSSSTRWPRLPGQGPRRADVAVGQRRLPRAAVIDAVVAVRCGGPLPEDRPDVPAGDRARAAAHSGVAGDLGGCQRRRWCSGCWGTPARR